MLSEAQHKAKNTFATIYAVVARHAATSGKFGAEFDTRLAALARSHDLLESGEVTLGDVVERAIAPFSGGVGQAHVAGPSVSLNSRTGAVLNSIFHELATNAAKYGAFSVPNGYVEVTWSAEDTAVCPAPKVVVIWREVGGPPVFRPSRRGFGTRVIEDQLGGEGGSVNLEFRPEGVSCRIQLPNLSER